jgi:hypothetical protein
MGQIDKLASFIMNEIEGEPSQDEGAGDCAIRIIKEYQRYARQDAIMFSAQYAYSLANLIDREKLVTDFKEPPSIVYEQFERAYHRWLKHKNR